MGFINRDEAVLLYNIARTFRGRHALEVNRCRKREIELHQGCLVGVVTRRFGQRQSERPGGPPAQMPFGPFWPLRQG